MSNPIEVTLTHRMNLPDEENLLDRMAQGVVSTPMDRPEGPLKVSGTATYADEDHPPGTAYGWFVRAAITSGRVTGLNTRELEAMPGVLAVIRDNRMIRNPAQGGDAKAPHQGPAEIFYKGQPIALVVAETIGAQSGIGFLAMDAREFLRTDVIVLTIVIYALIGVAADGIARTLERRLLAWHPNYGSAR